MTVLQSHKFRRGIAAMQKRYADWWLEEIREMLWKVATAWPEERTDTQLLELAKVLCVSPSS